MKNTCTCARILLLSLRKFSSNRNTKKKLQISEKLVNATKKVALSLPGDAKQTEKDLLSRLLANIKETEAVPDQKTNIQNTFQSRETYSNQQLYEQQPMNLVGAEAGSVLSTLLAESGDERQTMQRDSQDYFKYRDANDSHGKRSVADSLLSKDNLFNGMPLNIFPQPLDSAKIISDSQTFKSLWDTVAEEQLELLQYQLPKHGFDEMICLTKEGKLWKFPIDNEQDWHEESNVGFEEHVFFNHLLQDVPKSGPIRHFMELVTTGLGQNPYLSVEQKHSHITWFKEYFKDKQQLIEDLIAHEDK